MIGGGGGAARGDRFATGDSLRGGSGEFARMKFVICVRSGLLRGASTSVARSSLTLGLCGGSNGALDTVTSNFSASRINSLYFLSASLSASSKESFSRTGGAAGAWLRRLIRGGVAPAERGGLRGGLLRLALLLPGEAVSSSSSSSPPSNPVSPSESTSASDKIAVSRPRVRMPRHSSSLDAPPR